MEQWGNIVKKIATTLVRKIETLISITFITMLFMLGNDVVGVEQVIPTRLTEIGFATICLVIDYVPTRLPLKANITRTICGFDKASVRPCPVCAYVGRNQYFRELSESTTTINFPCQYQVHQTDKLRLLGNYDEVYWEITEELPEGTATYRLGYTAFLEEIRFDNTQFQLIGKEDGKNLKSRKVR